MTIKIKCSICDGKIDFNQFMKSSVACPNCNTLWDFKKARKNKLRRY